MPTLFIYLIKANIALTLFFLAYRFGLRRLTFYTTNRYFLLFGIVFSASFPLFDISDFFSRHGQLAGSVTSYAPDWSSLQQYMQHEDPFTAWSLVQYLFWAGVIIMGLRFSIQLFSLLRIHLQTENGTVDREKVKLMSAKINPFSFFKNIYINPAIHTPEELKTIMAHEKIHANGWHTADVLLGEINHIFYWFNPGAWLMKTAIRENLEFITDRQVLRLGTNIKAYQYSLIKASGNPYRISLANNFNFAHLKQRIRMMNKKRSSRFHILRYLLLLPVVALAALMITSSNGQIVQLKNGVPAILKSEIQQAHHHQTLRGNEIDPAFRQEANVSVTAIDTQGVASHTATMIRTPNAQHSSAVTLTSRHQNRDSVPRTHAVSLRPGHPQPIYIVDDKVVDSNYLHNYIQPEDIDSITVLKDASAISRYGNKGRNGVIIVRTKKKTGIQIVPKKNLSTDSNAPGRKTISVGPAPKDVLYVIDGKIEKVNLLNPKDIESITILKKDSAIEKYGEKGRNGVVEITTKQQVETVQLKEAHKSSDTTRP